MSQIGTGKAANRVLTIFGRFADWLGSARRENEDISSDALRIATLETHLKTARSDLARAIQGNAAWAAKYESLKAETASLVAYALKRKAALAKYEGKRGK